MSKRKKDNDDMDSLIDKDRMKRIYRFISRGVKIIDPLTTYIAEGVKIGKGTVIHPLTVIESGVKIGRDCSVGPFSRIRKDVVLKDSVVVGNFVEVVRSVIGNNCKVKHLTYIGDTTVEKDVNVGAGTIVANYDGRQKNKVRIKEKAFIGSGSILIAPLKVGKRSMVGAGAVVTKNKDVPDDSVVMGVPAKKKK